jgi:alpha-glutamyl/putrescinyl thymine pyrophosphorylase clade 1
MKKESLVIINRKQLPRPSKVFDTYWKFAAKRQDIFFNKIDGKDYPWTDDETLRKYKFTNTYRASDRVSQYLIKNVIYEGDQRFDEVLFRTILFKTFNKIDSWTLLRNEIGEITTKNFKFKQFSKIFFEAIEAGEAIYSGAYIMASGKSKFGYDRKFQNHLRLIEMMIEDKISEKILKARSLETIFQLLNSYPTIGNFLAYQYAIDLNYSASLEFSEMEYVMPGPGAKDGIRKCFTDYGGYDETEIVKYVTDIQEQEFQRLGLQFKTLWGRRLHLIDSQNLFCEVDKYARVLHPEISGLSNRKRIKQLYLPNKEQFEYWYPPKWGINIKIEEYGKRKERFHQSL